jgi:hypothetical protein
LSKEGLLQLLECCVSMAEQRGHDVEALERGGNMLLLTIPSEAGVRGGGARDEEVQLGQGFIGLGEVAEAGAV